MKQWCPFCGGFVYRGTSGDRQAYRCNDSGRVDCPFGREPIARKSEQLERAMAEFEEGSF